MNILALDTTTNKCSIAIILSGKIMFYDIGEKNRHSEIMLPTIEHALYCCNIWYEQLDYVALTLGPGSFTGIRVGIAACQSICFLTKAITVSSTTFELYKYKLCSSIKTNKTIHA